LTRRSPFPVFPARDDGRGKGGKKGRMKKKKTFAVRATHDDEEEREEEQRGRFSAAAIST